MAVLRDPLKMAVPSEQSSDYDTRPTTSQGKKGIAANYSESSSADGIAFGKPGASFPWGSRNRLLYTLLRGDSSSCSDSLSSFSSFSFPKPFKHINSYLLNPSKRSGLTSSSTTFTQRDSSMPATDSDTSSHILSSSNPQVEESSLASDVCNQNLSSSASQFERNSSVLSTDSCSLLPDSTDSQYTYYMNFLSQPSLLSYLEEVIQKTVEQLLSAKTADGISLFNVVEPKAEKKNPPPEENKTSEVFTAFRCHSNISSVSESLSALLGKDTKANGTLNNKKHLPSQKQKASSVKPPLAVKADVPTSCSPALTFDSKLESERLAKKKLPYSKKRKPKSAPKDKKVQSDEQENMSSGNSLTELPTLSFRPTKVPTAEEQEEILSVLEDYVSLVTQKHEKHKELSSKFRFLVYPPREAFIRKFPTYAKPEEKSKHHMELAPDGYSKFEEIQGHNKRCLASHPPWACDKKGFGGTKSGNKEGSRSRKENGRRTDYQAEQPHLPPEEPGSANQMEPQGTAQEVPPDSVYVQIRIQNNFKEQK
ncbi:uncharacterized protein LOC102354387 [Latimeria chalumnae]|uniref:uncharacterized protein LOC102354387 n=1 Tax=Latimeria chalumnae TaxID=7897 RepID=UPI0003C12AE6|nr:PREDICTED: uncharacterized protein LOC102354387 isoform X2 [Latimeria chalumnae]|eukprot:XP_014340617.1 PREDICTED: uncharacterized protein LOC102354387 isoform X2 [Latimeria chalumnae]